MSKPEMDFPSRVKCVRENLNLSQEDLARELGMSFSTVNRWENGKNHPIKVTQSLFDAFCAKMIRQGKLDRNLLQLSDK